jgi:predicted transcriptional regulator
LTFVNSYYLNLAERSALAITFPENGAKKNRAMSNIKTKRDTTDLFAEILEQCKQPTARYRIMHQVHISYPRTLKLLAHLVKIELLKLGADDKRYEVTEKGLAYLKGYSELQKEPGK